MQKKNKYILVFGLLFLAAIFLRFTHMDWEIGRKILAVAGMIALAVVVYMRWTVWFAPKPPPPNQAWLTGLRVKYHPARVEVDINIPSKTEVVSEVLGPNNEILLMWEHETFESGNFSIERTLEGLGPGKYGFRIATESQSTVRRFTIKE